MITINIHTRRRARTADASYEKGDVVWVGSLRGVIESWKVSGGYVSLIKVKLENGQTVEVPPDRLGKRGTRDARMYPSYSITELERWLTDPNVPAETKEKARAEIAARKSGASQPRITPQIAGGKAVPKLGRM